LNILSDPMVLGYTSMRSQAYSVFWSTYLKHTNE